MDKEQRRRKSSNLVDLHVLVHKDLHAFYHEISPSPGDFSKIINMALEEFKDRQKKKIQDALKAIDDAGKV